MDSLTFLLTVLTFHLAVLTLLVSTFLLVVLVIKKDRDAWTYNFSLVISLWSLWLLAYIRQPLVVLGSIFLLAMVNRLAKARYAPSKPSPFDSQEARIIQ